MMKGPFMRTRNYRTTCSVMVITVLMTVVTSYTSLGATSEMRMRLRRVIQEETQDVTTTNSLTRIEARYMQEYHSTKLLDDKLFICQEMVRLHVNAGMRNTAKIEEFVTRGLTHATSAFDRGDLLVALGDAKVTMSRRDRTLAASRAECVRFYVEAWCELRKYGHIGKLQELPSVDLFDGPSDTNDPIYKAMAQEHEEQVLTRKEVKQRNWVLRLRSRILGQIRVIYSTAKEDELRRDLKSVADDDDVLRDILAGVASGS